MLTLLLEKLLILYIFKTVDGCGKLGFDTYSRVADKSETSYFGFNNLETLGKERTVNLAGYRDTLTNNNPLVYLNGRY